MRLTHIKLAGFKSFVDPTHITLPGQIVGVVGPNGCGKSNVIDALRWVLGESKASALRGESMQDVIFNGTDKRKPVARASVELVFDNALGKAAGQWSTYAEISIKRVLKRDGGSTYYINNQVVRRKDVTDIFLGTGLGARAYAIIEQGMISRIIEAKPEELRVFLEEAAGVSKYRDRRRETELRLADTRENLLRVDDIRHELEKQLVHLGEQAVIAGRYRELESQRQNAQHLLWLVNKKEALQRQERHVQAGAQARNGLESEIARLREIELTLEEARSAHYAMADALHMKQGALYEVNAEIARIEQQIAFLQEQRNRLSQQIASGDRQIAQQRTQLQGVTGLLEHWRQQQIEAEMRLEVCEVQAAEQAETLPEVETDAREAREKSAAAQREYMLLQQQIQGAETQRIHLQRALQQLDMRRVRLAQEQANLPQQDLTAVEEAQARIQEIEFERQMQQQQLAELQQQLPERDAQRREARNAVHELEKALGQTEARLNALKQLQNQVDQDKKLKDWLMRYRLDGLGRLWQNLQIEAGWEVALEAVLRERLNALMLARIEDSADWQEAPPAKLALYAPASGWADVQSPLGDARPLYDLVHCRDTQALAVLQEWLRNVYAVETLQQGLTLRNALPPGALLVTRQGHCLTRHSALFHAPDNQVHGMLARQREIEQLQQDVRQQAVQLEQARGHAQQAEHAFQALEASLGPARAAGSELQQRLHALQLRALKLTQDRERNNERAQQLAVELNELAEQCEMEQQHVVEIDERVAELQERIAMHQAELDSVREVAENREEVLRSRREQVQQAQHALQEARFFSKTCADKIADLEHNQQRAQETLLELEQAMADTHAELSRLQGSEPQGQLQSALELRLEREQILAEARNALESATDNLRLLEQERLRCEQSLQPLREKLNELTLKEQEARLQAEQWAEQLQGVDEQPLLAQLEANPVRSGNLQSELSRLAREIEALGAVNLAALEELQTAQERKQYLDAQSQDLTEAMATLEEAIRRIDKESRDLLMGTYNEVNRHLSEMFPVLFAGGEARLVLTGEEILDSGVQVMAQPPGKKNSSIHLLSGGEKALTAIALVFSLFQLNPAPFCLLDEVDAPLDDTNTERLCALIRKMAQQTQFVFISHNKIAMEMAQQLIGVTMQEKGVSKVVAVDVEEALRMSEPAPSLF